MSEPATLTRVLRAVRDSNLVPAPTLDALLATHKLPPEPAGALHYLVQAGLLTPFHAHHLLQGRYKGFTLGNYKILRPLGQGGVGLVYLAEHSGLKRRVAIKVLRKDRQTEEAVQRFIRESRAAAALDHPNLIRVHDFCQENDVYFLVMEYVRGQSFAELLKRRGRLPSWEAVGLVLQAARGLAHAHARNIIHRDVNPSNLLVDADGVVKILDLGLARFLDHRADGLTERLGGRALGLPHFAAPEQELDAADERSDIYSLGATLHALLTGEPPAPESYDASPLLVAHPLREVAPEELSLIVTRMLARRPADRFQTVEEVIAALSPWAERPAVPSAAPPAAETAQAGRPGWRRQAALWSAAGATVLLAGIAAWAVVAAH